MFVFFSFYLSILTNQTLQRYYNFKNLKIAVILVFTAHKMELQYLVSTTILISLTTTTTTITTITTTTSTTTTTICI